MANKTLTEQQKVRALYEEIAGDKLGQCDAYATPLITVGFKPERAWAEALDRFKLFKNERVEE